MCYIGIFLFRSITLVDVGGGGGVALNSGRLQLIDEAAIKLDFRVGQGKHWKLLQLHAACRNPQCIQSNLSVTKIQIADVVALLQCCVLAATKIRRYYNVNYSLDIRRNLNDVATLNTRHCDVIFAALDETSAS